jgi:PTS system nitrogen regulatory IIA component
MTITDLVAPEAILPALKVNSKKQALQELAARAASLTGQNERSVFEVLLQREKLGTTAVGYGVAIPHGKLPKLEKLFGLFRGLNARSISRRWTASRSTWCSCCWRRKARAPII